MPGDFIQIGQANFQRGDILGKPTTFKKDGETMNRVQLKNGLVFEFSNYESGLVKISEQGELSKVSVFMSNAKIYGDYSSDATKDMSYKAFVLDVKGDNNDIDTSKDQGGFRPECGCQSGIDDIITVQGSGNSVTIGKNDVLTNGNNGEYLMKPKTYKI